MCKLIATIQETAEHGKARLSQFDLEINNDNVTGNLPAKFQVVSLFIAEICLTKILNDGRTDIANL